MTSCHRCLGFPTGLVPIGFQSKLSYKKPNAPPGFHTLLLRHIGYFDCLVFLTLVESLTELSVSISCLSSP